MIHNQAKPQSRYHVSAIQVHWADVIICKSLIQSLFQYGMANMVFNIRLLEATALGALLIYTPFFRTGIKIEPVTFVHWLPADRLKERFLLHDVVQTDYEN